MEARRILVLVDGIHTRELLAGLGEIVRSDGTELVLVYVVGHGPRASLDMVRRRPGGVHMPPHRERSLSTAERARAGEALEEAARLVPPAARVRTAVLEGEPGHAMVELAVRERAVALVVRGAPRGLGPIGRFIADHAPCAVIFVR